MYKIKCGKAAGMDGIADEFLKKGDQCCWLVSQDFYCMYGLRSGA